MLQHVQHGLCALIVAGLFIAPASGDDASTLPTQQFRRLHADDARAGDTFGHAAAISGPTAIVGASGSNNNGPGSGSAYIFDVQTGQQLFKLLPENSAAYDIFGSAVAISGTRAIVSAPHDDTHGDNSGVAYIFDVKTGQQLFRLHPQNIARGYNSGGSVAISETQAAINAVDSDGYGLVCLFDLKTGQQLFKLIPVDSTAGDQFGRSVAFSGSLAIIGATGSNDNGQYSGSAYLFDLETGQQLFKLLPDDGTAGDQFGISVEISGSLAIVGAPGDDDNGEYSGSAYLFDLETGQQLFKFLPDDGTDYAEFGSSVAISGTQAIVGAPGDVSSSGATYFFDTQTGQQLFKLLPRHISVHDSFGAHVAISGSQAIVGAPGNDDNVPNSGSVYVFVPFCSGDCAVDRFVNFNDIVSMIFQFGNDACDTCNACDADASGTVDFNDLVTALFLFGPCE